MLRSPMRRLGRIGSSKNLNPTTTPKSLPAHSVQNPTSARGVSSLHPVNPLPSVETKPHCKAQHRSSTTAMSTMPASHGHNQACCNIPPVLSSGYVAKGSYKQIENMKTYVTGPPDATKGIVVIFDIFGFYDQTIQGADILAVSNEYQQYKVFMPDWFQGKPVPMEWFPPDNEEKQKKLGEWFGAHGPQDVAAMLENHVEALQAANPSIESWGILGFCWGGKVVELVTSTPSNPFTIAAAAHPAMIEPAGADKIPVPYILIASGEEPVDTVKEFESRLKVPHQVETFSDQVHGFMAARGDLSDDHVKAEYARGYQLLLDFFGKHWA